MLCGETHLGFESLTLRHRALQKAFCRALLYIFLLQM